MIASKTCPADPGDPHHGGGGIADDRPGPACIGSGDDGREIADVDLGLNN